MAAKKKSASRRSVAKTKSKIAKPRPKTKKVTKKAAKKKAVKKKVAKKKVAVRKKPVPVTKRPVRRAARPALPSPELAALDQRIAILQNNLRDLTEQGAGASGGASEELLSDRIANYEAELQRLLKERDALA
jgi:outer membrane biosynthesis protein TonB